MFHFKSAIWAKSTIMTSLWCHTWSISIFWYAKEETPHSYTMVPNTHTQDVCFFKFTGDCNNYKNSLVRRGFKRVKIFLPLFVVLRSVRHLLVKKSISAAQFSRYLAYITIIQNSFLAAILKRDIFWMFFLLILVVLGVYRYGASFTPKFLQKSA